MLEGHHIEETLEVLGCTSRVIPVLAVLILGNMCQVHLNLASLGTDTLPFRCHPSSSSRDHHLNTTAYLLNDGDTFELEPIGKSVYSTRVTANATDSFDNKCLEPSSPSLIIVTEEHNASDLPLQIPSRLHSTGMSSCPYVQYDHSVYSSTIVSQFDLVCERSTLRPLYHVLCMVGAFISGALASPLGDRFGRVRTMRLLTLLSIPTHLATIFMPWYTGVILMRMLNGFLFRALGMTCVTFAMESMPPQHRTVTGSLMGLPYTMMGFLSAVSGYFLGDWKLIILIAGVPIVLLLPALFMAEESPRWLAQKGHSSTVAQNLLRAARKSDVTLPAHLLNRLEDLPVKQQDKSLKEENNPPVQPPTATNNIMSQFLQFPVATVILVGVCVIWLNMDLMYYAILLNSNTIQGGRSESYVMVLTSLEMVAMVAVMPLTKRLGRCPVLLSGPLVAGLILFIDLFVPQDLEWVQWLVTVISFFTLSGAHQVLFIYGAEIFPTVIRSTGLGVAACMGMMGSLIAPFLIDILDEAVWWGSGLVMGLSGSLIALIVYFLPETKDSAMPDTLYDLAELKKRQTPPPPESVRVDKI